MEPKIVTGRGHQEKNQQREKSQRLKRKIGQASISPVAHKEAHQRMDIAEAVELQDRKHAMRESQQKHGYAQVTAIVEQRKKATIEAAQRADAQNQMQQQQRGRAEAADQQRLRRGIGMDQGAESHKHCQVQQNRGSQHRIVDPLLAIPSDSLILNTHGKFLSATRPSAPWLSRLYTLT